MSDELIIDLTNYKDRVGNRVIPGRYTVLVEDAEQDTAKSGNDMINLWLRVQGGDFEGATIVDRLVLTEKSMFRVVGFMQAIGLPTPRKRLRVNTRQFIGRVLDIDVEDGDPYQGRVKSEVRGYMRSMDSQAMSDGTPEDLDDLSGLDEFAAGSTSNPSAVRDETTQGVRDDTSGAAAERRDRDAAAAPDRSGRVAATDDVLADDIDLADIDLG